jgi:hypothetical protein
MKFMEGMKLFFFMFFMPFMVDHFSVFARPSIAASARADG